MISIRLPLSGLVSKFSSAQLRSQFRLRTVATVVVLAAVAAAYGALYAWVCDDAHISFRYARQLLLGHGLVFNPGERVEGYTNFLWVLELALLHQLTGISFAALGHLISGACSAGTFVMTWVLARRTPVVALRPFVAIAAIAWLALNRNVALWSTSGLETRQFTFLIVLAVVLAHDARGRAPRLLGASLALAAAQLTRPEGMLLFASVVAWQIVESRVRGTLRPKPLLLLAGPFVAIAGAHFLFRYAYYGDWAPNTYYAKFLRPWPDAGLDYLAAVGVQSALYLVVPLAILGGFYRWVHRQDTLHVLSACLIVPHIAYVVRVGGDHFEFRLFDFYWPLLAVAMAEGLGLIVLLVWSYARRRHWFRPRLLALVSGWLGLTTVVAYAAAIQLAEYALTYDLPLERRHVDAKIERETFPLAYLLPGMETLAPLYNGAMSRLLPHAIAVRWREHYVFARRQQDSFADYGTEPRRRLPPDAVMAYPYAGIAPFHLTDLTIVDTLGLTDAVVARHGGGLNSARVMAHDRSPPPGYLEQRGVNLEVLPAAGSLAEALTVGNFAVPLREGLWMPFESPKPDWARIAFRGYPLYQRPHFERSLSASTAIVADRQLRGHQLIGGFDDTTDEWRLSGAFVRQTRRPKSQSTLAGYHGKGWLSSFGASEDRGVGTATSPRISAAPGDVLVFLIAGGADEEVGVELVVDAVATETWRGRNSEAFSPIFVDLSPHAGRKIVLRAFDRSRHGWGHIMIDQVLLMR